MAKQRNLGRRKDTYTANGPTYRVQDERAEPVPFAADPERPYVVTLGGRMVGRHKTKGAAVSAIRRLRGTGR